MIRYGTVFVPVSLEIDCTEFFSHGRVRELAEGWAEREGGALAEGPPHRMHTAWEDYVSYAFPVVREVPDQGGTEHVRMEEPAQ